MSDSKPVPIATDLDVLREMVRLAERRRDEQLQMIEKVNHYNFATIAFSGSFLSLLVTNDFPKLTVLIAGFFLLTSIVISIITIRPRTLHEGAISIEDDVKDIREGKPIDSHLYLLDTADITHRASMKASILVQEKKKTTMYSALCLAFALATTYILYVYYA